MEQKNFIVQENFSFVHTIFKRFYTPFLMKTPVRIAVLVVFIAALITHVVVLPNINIGLDQKLSMPGDSYVLKYFEVMYAYLCNLFFSLRERKRERE